MAGETGPTDAPYARSAPSVRGNLLYLPFPDSWIYTLPSELDNPKGLNLAGLARERVQWEAPTVEISEACFAMSARHDENWHGGSQSLDRPSSTSKGF